MEFKFNVMKLIFTGIRPTGKMHLGNLFGMFNTIKEDKDSTIAVMLADLHAINNGPITEEMILNKAAEIYALSNYFKLNVVIFRQSENWRHASLSAILSTLVPFGKLKTMINFKSNSSPSLGLLSYPVLMSADIILYNPDLVPVGEDQRQHIELHSFIVKRVNNICSTDFKSHIRSVNSIRIMDLKNPKDKMSKSSNNLNGIIYLTDDDNTISRKIMGALSSDIDIRHDNSEGTINLLKIYELCTNKDSKTLLESISGHLELKQIVAKEVIKFISPIRDIFNNVIQDKNRIYKLLSTGLDFSNKVSQSNYLLIVSKILKG